MIALRIEGANCWLGAPKGWRPESDGDCHHLAVRAVEEGTLLICESAWEPTPAELAILNAGGHVVLRVAGGQPPVALYAASHSSVAECQGDLPR